MAWTTPTNVATGDVLTASRYNNEVVGNALAGGPIFAAYTDLVAAIPTPYEGQRAYLTAPLAATVTAAGDTTYVPTGISLIHNGSGWVCVTEVGAFTAAGGTYASGTYGPTLSGSPGTNPAVTTITGATALVTITASVSISTTMTVGIDVAISGATTRLAGTTAGQNLNVPKSSDAGLAITYNHSFIVSGLTAGVNVFTLNYNSNNTGTITNRRLTVKGIA